MLWYLSFADPICVPVILKIGDNIRNFWKKKATLGYKVKIPRFPEKMQKYALKADLHKTGTGVIIIPVLALSTIEC